MLVVGLTGGIGVGKTTVAGLLARRGAVVLDVDAIGREVIGPDGIAVDAVVARFGEDVRGDDGGIDRPALAGKVFGDDAALRDLTEISHPAINRVLDEELVRIATEQPDSIVVLDMAVLAESHLGTGITHPYEPVVVVEAPTDIRLDRLVDRGMTRDDAEARMAAQASDEERRALAHFLINNGGDLDQLRDAVAELWSNLQRLAHQQTR